MPTVQTAMLKAKDVMTPEPVCIDPGTDIRRVLETFTVNEFSGAPVLGSDGTVVGVVSMSDLARLLVDGTNHVLPAYLFEAIAEQSQGDAEGIEAEPEVSVTVEDIMTDTVETVLEDASIADVAKLMHESRIHRIVVADAGGFPRGIITSLDLVGAMAKQSA